MIKIRKILYPLMLQTEPWFHFRRPELIKCTMDNGLNKYIAQSVNVILALCTQSFFLLLIIIFCMVWILRHILCCMFNSEFNIKIGKLVNSIAVLLGINNGLYGISMIILDFYCPTSLEIYIKTQKSLVFYRSALILEFIYSIFLLIYRFALCEKLIVHKECMNTGFCPRYNGRTNLKLFGALFSYIHIVISSLAVLLTMCVPSLQKFVFLSIGYFFIMIILDVLFTVLIRLREVRKHKALHSRLPGLTEKVEDLISS